MSEPHAIIDIGSNTVRLVVYDGPTRAPTVRHNEKVTARLGREVARSGLLSDKASATALAALARYAALVRLMGVTRVDVVATAAARDAANGGAFLDAVRALGLEPRLLAGEDEARISALGVTAAFPGAAGIAGDLGGGSLELTSIAAGALGTGITLPFGTLRLPQLRAEGAARFAARVRQALRAAGWAGAGGQPFYLVGGAWRAFAIHAIRQLDWPIDDPHGFELPPETALRLARALAQGKLVQEVPRISASRLAMLPDAAALLAVLVDQLQPARLVFSSWGLREGLLFEAMDPAVRARDPLLAGVADFAAAQGVDPAGADAVTDWIAPACIAAPGDGRLRTAAVLLALATQRSEPNFRAEEGLDWALRKRWIGLDTRGRAMLAAAVQANTGRVALPPGLAALAPPQDIAAATAWGLAFRLCRRLTAGLPEALAGTALERTAGELVLTLRAPLHPLHTEGTAKDLRALAQWLGREPRVAFA